MTATHLLVLPQRQHVHERAALRLAVPGRQLVHLDPVDLADGREEQQVVVRGGDEQVLDVVVLLGVHPDDADPAAALDAVGGERQPLDVAGARDRDDHVLLGDQLLEVDLALGRHDLGAAVVAELLADLDRAPRGSAPSAAPRRPGSRAARRSARAGRRARPVTRLRSRPVSARRRMSRIAWAWISVSSNCCMSPARAASASSAPADQRDDRVEVVERDQVALEHVRPPLGPVELELGAAGDHLLLVVEVVHEHLAQRQRARDAVDERDHVHAERALQRRVLEELVQRDHWGSRRA